MKYFTVNESSRQEPNVQAMRWLNQSHKTSLPCGALPDKQPSYSQQQTYEAGRLRVHCDSQRMWTSTLPKFNPGLLGYLEWPQHIFATIDEQEQRRWTQPICNQQC